MDSCVTRQTATASLPSTMMAGKPQSRARSSDLRAQDSVCRPESRSGAALQHVDDRQLVNSRELHRLVPAIRVKSVPSAHSATTTLRFFSSRWARARPVPRLNGSRECRATCRRERRLGLAFAADNRLPAEAPFATCAREASGATRPSCLPGPAPEWRRRRWLRAQWRSRNPRRDRCRPASVVLARLSIRHFSMEAYNRRKTS